MAVLHTPTHNLPYPDGNDLIRDGDNRIHDLAAALDGIIATVDQLEAIELTPGPPGPAGADGAAGGSSDIFRFRAKVPATTGDPGPGFLRWNTVPQVSATQLAIDVRDQDNLDVVLGLSALGAGNQLYLQEYSSGVDWQNWQITGAGTQVGDASTGYWTFPVTLLGSGGTGTTGFINGLMLAVRVTRPGPTGPTGPTGPAGLVWRGAWSSATAYAINDAVSKNGASYIAVAANTNSDPTAPAEAVAGTVGPAATAAFGSSPQTSGQPFTPTSSIQVKKVKITFFGAPSAQPCRIGIVTGTPSGAPTAWVGGNAYADQVIPGSGDVTVTLPSEVTLAASTLYHVVAWNNAGNLGGLGYSAATVTATGGTTGSMLYGTGFETVSALHMPFTLYSGAPSHWNLLAASGIPAGGTTGQVLKKLSAADYHVGWVT